MINLELDEGQAYNLITLIEHGSQAMASKLANAKDNILLQRESIKLIDSLESLLNEASNDNQN